MHRVLFRVGPIRSLDIYESESFKSYYYYAWVLEFKDDKVFFCCLKLKAEVFYSAVVFFCEDEKALCR